MPPGRARCRSRRSPWPGTDDLLRPRETRRAGRIRCLGRPFSGHAKNREGTSQEDSRGLLLETGVASTPCPRCGTENPITAKFCARCWALLRGPTCPHCGRPSTRAGVWFCEHCGGDLRDRPAFEAAQDEVPVAPPDVEPLVGQIPSDLSPEASPDIEQPAVEPSATATVEAEPPVEAPALEASPVIEPPVDSPAVPPVMEERDEAVVQPRPVLRSSGGPSIAAVVLAVVTIAVVAAVVGSRRQQATVQPRPSPAVARDSAAPAPTGAPVPAAPAPAVTDQPPLPTVGILRITTVPPGAQVEVNGTPAGTTPLAGAEVQPGRHTIRLSRSGYRAITRQIEIGAGETVVLDLTLSAAPAAPRRTPPPPPPPPPPRPP